ncbi:hypothetical protein H0H81_000623 [Sphagnurus paluster]|uniref:DH domain-containing protein n=1 Tax=Sphagnurus paluster TaxID=117069 RepID=A0A9P7KIV0_9AGAR|nr:hypothetical protein H0H81_000623 [Sphagnurus paluster]
MPVAYPSDAESTSESSLEATSTAHRSTEEKQAFFQRGRRQSLMNDLPQLEANLLPSLRDTITRMTRSPSSGGRVSPPEKASRLGIPKSTAGGGRSSRSLSPAGAINQTSFRPDMRDYPKTDTTDVYEARTPETSHSNDFPFVNASDILIPRTNLPPKPPVKSSLRPPAPKLFSKTTDHNYAPTRSVRSILKTASNASSINIEEETSQKAVNKGSKNDVPMRSRSRTDPGCIPIAFFQDSRTRSSHKSNPDHKETLQSSSIPRLQGKRNGSDAQWSTDESSDFESRYETENRSRRHLVVANAEVFPSSSESDLERAERTRGRTNETAYRSKNHRNSHGDGRGLGLGFDLDSDGTNNRTGSPRKDIGCNTSSERPTRRTEEPQTPSRSSRSSNQTQEVRSYRNHETLDVSSDHQRRREALLGIVSRLDLDRSTTAPSQHSESELGDEGSMNALSHYPDERDRNKHTSSEQQQRYKGDLEHEIDNQVQPPARPRKDRHRSSSCTPTPTLIFPNDNNTQPSWEPASYLTATLHPDQYLGASHSRSRSPKPPDKPQKSPLVSRSPIIPQTDTNGLPAALKRHSVYHRAHSPNPPPADAGENKAADKKPNGKQVHAQRRGEFVDSRPFSAAARERKAYGMPPSDFDGDYQSNRRTLPHVDSDLSSVGSVYWDDDESELSPAAETLFKTLGGDQRGDRRSQQSNGHKALRSAANSRAPSPSFSRPAAENPSQNRALVEPRREEHRARFQLPSPPAPAVRAQDTSRDTELRRQDIIIEIQQAEESFVKRLQVFVNLFILPLRVQSSKDWISGVPPEVARLFDWLEDIVVLHGQILASLNAVRSTEYSTVERIADSIRVFVPRLEVYQPYLVKLMDVVTLIDQLMQDEHSDFGEYMRLQEDAPECEGWTFQDFLIEPVNALAKFPELFTKLLELTPRGHCDYLPTTSLVHTTDMFIRVMTEVKIREDEYDLIQKFSTRIQGITPSVQLATRERRLFYQGVLHLLGVEEATKDGSASTHRTSNVSRYFPPGALPTTDNKTSNLGYTIGQWDATGRGRSGSTSSTGVSGSQVSLKTVSSGFSLNGPPMANSTFFSSFRIPIPRGRLNQAPTKTPASPSPTPRLNLANSTPSSGMPIQVFVFSDLVILAAATSDSEGLSLLKRIGTIRILGAQIQERDKDLHDSDTIALEVLPVDTTKLNQPMTVGEADTVYILRLAIPPDDQETTRRCWASAFRRSHRFTLCALAVTSRQHDPQYDVALDKHQAVFSLLASGLPLPKSPSMQMADVGDDAMTQERQQRGWWALRFQQVFREIQRQDIALAAVLEETSLKVVTTTIHS